MAERGDVRVSDQQRDDAAAQLREHYASGRLDQDEFDERVQRTYAARTEAELRPILADLPALPVTAAQRRAELVARRRELRRRLVQEAGGGIGLFALCVVIWLSSGASGQFWPMWVAIIPALMLLRNGWRLYGPAPQLERVERELEQRAHRGGRRRQQRHDRRR